MSWLIAACLCELANQEAGCAAGLGSRTTRTLPGASLKQTTQCAFANNVEQ
jgi:hypothetical protein